MNSKGHFYTSLCKSLLRIVYAVVCAIIVPALTLPCVIFAVAEVLGIFEELVDGR